VRVSALGAAFEKKDLLKARGYCWYPGSDGNPKHWYRDVRDDDWAVGREDDRLARARARSLLPDAVERRAAKQRGRPPHPNLTAAARKANHHTPAWREKIRARFRKRGNWLRPHAVPWTPE
jgi:hypothetical protein